MTVLLAALAVAVLLLPPAPAGRLHEVLPVAPAGAGGHARPSAAGERVGRGPARRHARLPELGAPHAACLLAAVAVALLVGGVAGLLLGAVAAVLGPPLLGRLEPAAVRRERERLARDLPLALDLLAACLAGGAPLPVAVRAVSDAVPGPCGRRLARVAASLGVGSPPADAWSALPEGESPDRPVARPAVRALVRAAEGGAPVAATVAAQAAEARQQARARAQLSARRAGVAAVLPLGLCFLPAFVLLGVVPVVVGLAGPLLASL